MKCRSRAGRSRCNRAFLVLATAPLLWLGPRQTLAVNTDNWTAVSGGWATAGNWSGNFVPGANDIVNITPTDGLDRTITYNYTGSPVTLGSLTINHANVGPPQNGTDFSMAAKVLTATTETIANSGPGGNTGTATFNQTGGVNTAGSIFIANNATDAGLYNLGGSAALSVNSSLFVIGNSGNGGFAQSGSSTTSITNTAQLVAGYFAGSFGTYSLTNTATLTDVGNETIGYGGTGTFNHFGGSNHVVNFQLFLGYFAGASGTYNLNNSSGTSSLSVDLGEVIGFSGTGIFNHSAGTNVTPSLTLGLNSGGVGTYTLSGTGLVTVLANANIGGSANFGTGTLNIQGGTMTVAGTLAVSNSSSIVNLSAGSLSVGALQTVGFSSRFNWTGGALTINSPLYIWGVNNIDTPFGNSLTITTGQALTISSGNFENVAGGGAGITQNGGSNTTPSLAVSNINASSGPSAFYNLSGGTLSVANTETIGGLVGTASGIFNQTGGANTAGGVDLGDSPGCSGIYTLSGNAIANFNGGTVGNAIGAPGGVAVLNIQGGAMTVSFGLTLFNTPGAAINLSGGSLTVGSLDTQSDPSRFNWTGGVLNFNTNLFIKESGPLGASVNLSAGKTLAAGSLLENDGSITLAGGSLGGGGIVSNSGLLTGFGTISGTGGFVNLAVVTQAGGNLIVTNTGVFANAGNMQLAAGYQLQLNGGALSNDGTLDLNSATVTGSSVNNNSDGTLTGNGVILSAFSNAGLIVLESGTLKLPNFTNTGVIELDGAAAGLAAGSTLTNSTTVEGHGKISMTIVNNATIEATGGTLILAGSITNSASATLRSATGNKILITGSFPTNLGLLSLVGGTIDTNNQPLTNNGQISGFGVLATGGLINAGAMTFTGGSTIINGPVTNNATRSIVIKDQPALFTGMVVNNGTIKSTSTVATFAGGYSGPGTFTSDPSVNNFQSTIAISPGGSMTGSTGDQFLFNSGSVSNAGTFANGGLLQSSDNISNSGSFTQSGPQSWSPGATFSNTAGSATFSTDPGTTSTRNLSIAITGGTVKLSGPQHLQSLTLSGGSLDVSGDIFVASASYLALAASIASHAITTSSTVPAVKVALLTGSNFLLLNPSALRHGQTVLPTDTLLTFAYGGDSNLDDHINIDDYLQIDYAYEQHLTNTTWVNGDTNLNGSIDASDYAAIDTSYRLQSGPLADGEISLHTAEFGQAYTDAFAALNPSTIPEPASLWLLALGTSALVKRRR